MAPSSQKLEPPAIPARFTTNLSLLVDTGADVSALMPSDGIKLGIDYGSLINSNVVGGLGGNTNCFQENAVLVFHEPNRNLTRFYLIGIMIAQVNAHLMKTPSIIGRDILDRWRINYDPSRNSLRFTVRSADHTV